MRTERIAVNYQLQFESPFHIGTGLRYGLIHRSIARDANGFLYIPGSMLKGVLRDLATDIAQLLGISVCHPHAASAGIEEFSARSDITARIFGSRYRPGTLFFDDARLCDDDVRFFQPPQSDEKKYMAQQTEVRTQVSISRRTGAARQNALFSSEYGVPELCFDASIRGLLSGLPFIGRTETYSLALLIAALYSLEKIGGNKSVGAGRVSCTITQLRVDDQERAVDEYLELLPEFELYELVEDEEK